jgi:hypothetical protein
VRGLVEAVLPARMGTPFRWLVGSSWVGNLGDGIALAAGPLLVAGQTQDPFLVALGALLQRLPWLLFGLQAGVLAERVDRRRLLIGVDLARVASWSSSRPPCSPGTSASPSSWPHSSSSVSPRSSPTPPPARCCRWSSGVPTSASATPG